MTEDDIRTELPAHATLSRRAGAQPSPEATGSAPVATPTPTASTPSALATDPYTLTLKSGRTVKVRQIDGLTSSKVESLAARAGYVGDEATSRVIAAASVVSIDGESQFPPDTITDLDALLMRFRRIEWGEIGRRVAALDGLVEDPAVPAQFRYGGGPAAS